MGTTAISNRDRHRLTKMVSALDQIDAHQREQLDKWGPAGFFAVYDALQCEFERAQKSTNPSFEDARTFLTIDFALAAMVRIAAEKWLSAKPKEGELSDD